MIFFIVLRTKIFLKSKKQYIFSFCRRNMSSDEHMLMLKYIVNTKQIKFCKGNKVYESMHKEGVSYCIKTNMQLDRFVVCERES